MKIEIHTRVKGGWQTSTIEASPTEVRRLKADTTALRVSRSIGDNLYDLKKYKLGERIAGRASGTLTELHRAGIDL